MSPIIEGNVTYSNINYDGVLVRAQADPDVTGSDGYDEANIQFDFYTGDCSNYASPAGHACTTDNGSVGVCIDITPSLGSSSGNVFVCNPSSLANSENIDTQAINQISVDLPASDSGGDPSGSGPSDTRYYAIQSSEGPIHSSFCYDTCGDVNVCSDNDDCCLCNGANWLNYIFTEKPRSSVESTAISLPTDTNLPASTQWIEITNPESGNTTQTSDTTMRFFNIFDDAEPIVDNHDLFWTNTINREANYMASQGTFLRESDPEPYELVDESYTIQNFPGYIESSVNSRVTRSGYYEECLYRSVLGDVGNRCVCPLNYRPVNHRIDSKIDNRLCAPCDVGSISDGIFESGDSLTCGPCNTRGQVVNQDGECDHCHSENNLNRMYYEGECLDVGDAVIQSECVPIDPGTLSGCPETHHITGGSLDGTYNHTLSNFYIDCITTGSCKVEQSIIEGFGNIESVPDNIQDKNTTHDLYINEVCRSLPAPVCERFQECSLDTDNNRCVLNLDDTQCFDTVKVPTPAQGDYQNILTLRNPSDTILSCNYPSQENQQDTIVDGYVIPFMGNQVTQDTFTTQVTCDPLSESDIPGFVGEVKGFCLEEGQPILMTGCIPGDVMNRLTLPTTTGAESTLQNRCEELSETYPVSLRYSSGYYHSETSDQMADSGCYFQIEGGCDVTGTGGCEGATCECESDYYRDDCSEHCVASGTCSGNGTCNDVGECVCEGEWTGDNCSTDPQCANSNIECVNGTISGTMVEDNCACNCDDGYEEDTCETASACLASSAELEDLSSGRIHCQNGGQPTGTTGNCECNCGDGYYGDHCQYSRTTTCNGRGDPGDDGNCACDDGWINNEEHQCSQCADNYYGDDCSVYCEASVTCTDHGACNSDGSCNCETEWIDDGENQCSQCADNYYGDNCSRHCTRENTTAQGSWQCSGNGNCNSDGQSCACDPDYEGRNCQYSRSPWCNGNGSPNYEGSCNCDEGYYGDQCDVYCEASVTCNGHGTCGSDGSCICETEWIDDGGNQCSQCVDNYYGDNCVYCLASDTCNGQGTCNTSDGTCNCNDTHFGENCQYSSSTNCNNHGTPNNDGYCDCEGWWFTDPTISEMDIANKTNQCSLEGVDCATRDSLEDNQVCSHYDDTYIGGYNIQLDGLQGFQVFECRGTASYTGDCFDPNDQPCPLNALGHICGIAGACEHVEGVGGVCNCGRFGLQADDDGNCLATQCLSSHYWEGASCIHKLGQGSSCSRNNQCQSDNCTNCDEYLGVDVCLGDKTCH